MAEQFIKAYSLEIEELMNVIGSDDRSIIKSIKENEELMEEVEGLIQEMEEGTVEEFLIDIITNKLYKNKAYAYVRVLELLLEVKADRLDEEAVFPGRGWQDIGKIFSKWGLPTLAKIWCSPHFKFPWPKEVKVELADWPIAMLIERKDIPTLKAEIKNFNPAITKKHPLPERQKGLEEEVVVFLEQLKNWISQYNNKDVVLLLDGQQ